MLAHLSIHQFALVEHLELELDTGMSVITGETGAGKSILFDALGLALGERAEADCVRHGADRADISASFTSNESAKAWLQQRDIPCDDDIIILRRVISNEGRSRGYINGRAASATDLKELGHLLIEIHSQHAHHRLLQKDTARQLLDAYANATLLSSEVALLWQEWQQSKQKLLQLTEESSETKALRQLLTYQVEELSSLNLTANELDELEAEHKRLANAESMLLNGQNSLSLCKGDDQCEQAALQLTYQALQRLNDIDDQHPALEEAREMLHQAHIQLEEAGLSLQHYLDQVDMNPHRLQQVEQRLSDIFSMARKHQIQPQRLYDYAKEQEEALNEISLNDEGLQDLEQQVKHLHSQFLQQAQKLSDLRREAAQKMDTEIESHFDALALSKARFVTNVETLDVHMANRHGIDNVQFMVQTNPGMPAGPLAKVASGGELARISLAIQVVTAAISNMPCLIFDEVDVGIGGGTAERVGRLLRKLGENSQVLCVTHQPQVAAQAHQHYQVSKISGDSATHTNLRQLEKTQRAEEIARMLGGVEITQQTLAHAQEMLSMAQ